MVEQGLDGYYKIIKDNKTELNTRQQSPKVYDLNASFYFYRREFFELNYKSVMTDKALVYEVPHLCFDIDEPLDFDIMEYLIASKKSGIEIWMF